MTTGFSRTLRTLRADDFAWGGWCSVARVTLYEVTESARLGCQLSVVSCRLWVAG
jgi:hypothetical protein